MKNSICSCEKIKPWLGWIHLPCMITCTGFLLDRLEITCFSTGGKEEGWARKFPRAGVLCAAEMHEPLWFRTSCFLGWSVIQLQALCSDKGRCWAGRVQTRKSILWKACPQSATSWGKRSASAGTQGVWQQLLPCPVPPKKPLQLHIC